MNKKAIKRLLTEICTIPAVSGDEDTLAELLCEKLETYCPDAQIINGNVIGSTGNQNPNATNIVLDAHMDQIGMIVTGITKDGFVTVGNIGGLDRRWFPAQRVCLHGTQDIYGIISTMPPHLSNEKEKVQKIDQIRIDTGYSANALKQILSPGDSITFTGITDELPGERFTSPALDDRAGIAAIFCALDELCKEELDCKVTVLFSTQEEVGELGAKTGGFKIHPDIAIAVDVSFAGNGTKNTGIAGQGAMIGISPSLSRIVSQDLIDTAIEEKIPYQHEVMSGTTGTNADQFSVCREGVKTCTVSIPLFYMHTPVEVVELKDIKNTGRLLAAYVREVE